MAGTTRNKMNKATRDRKGERDYWLDHYDQYQPGRQRTSSNQTITSADYIAIPIPSNMPTPLALPCLIWRWGLGGGGYGAIGGRNAHVVAYEQSRNCQVSADEGEQVNHLCHRPFCIQPAHLYIGNAKTNAEDRQALRSEMAKYQTWDQINDRWDKAGTGFYWEAPEIEEVSLGLMEPLDCPHDVGTIQSGGDAVICSNCGELGRSPDAVGHRTPCWERWRGSPPCRCEPCCCRSCLYAMLEGAQRAFDKMGGLPIHTLGGAIPEHFLDETAPLTKAEARRIRATLEVWTRTNKETN